MLSLGSIDTACTRGTKRNCVWIELGCRWLDGWLFASHTRFSELFTYFIWFQAGPTKQMVYNRWFCCYSAALLAFPLPYIWWESNVCFSNGYVGGFNFKLLSRRPDFNPTDPLPLIQWRLGVDEIWGFFLRMGWIYWYIYIDCNMVSWWLFFWPHHFVPELIRTYTQREHHVTTPGFLVVKSICLTRSSSVPNRSSGTQFDLGQISYSCYPLVI